MKAGNNFNEKVKIYFLIKIQPLHLRRRDGRAV